MFKSKKYIFVFSHTPSGRSIPKGVFPLELEGEAQNFANEASGYRVMMIGDWIGFGKLPELGELRLYEPKKLFRPFKVCPHDMKTSVADDESPCALVVLDAPGFETYEIFEGTVEDCIKECETLNKMLQTHLNDYTRKK